MKTILKVITGLCGLLAGCGWFTTIGGGVFYEIMDWDDRRVSIMGGEMFFGGLVLLAFCGVIWLIIIAIEEIKQKQ